MKNKGKMLLLFALGSILVGISLGTFGLLTGGLDAVKTITKPTKNVKTYDHITDIDLKVTSKVTIEEANVQTVTVTYYSGSKFLNKVNLSQEKGKLTVKQTSPQYIISGPLEAYGYYLNVTEHNSDVNDNPIEKITIQVPKGMPIQHLTSGIAGQTTPTVQLKQVTLKTIDVNGSIDAEKTSIEGGQITGYLSSYFRDSKLQNLTIEGSQYLSFDKSTVDSSKISYRDSGLDITKSVFKNTTITTDGDVTTYTEYDGTVNYNTPYTRLTIDQSMLENLTYKGIADIDAREVIFKGDNSFTGDYYSGKIDLASATKDTTSLDLTIDDGELSIDSRVNPSAKDKKPITQFRKTADKATGKLTFKAKYGELTVE